MNKLADSPAFPHHETTSRGEPFYDHLGLTKREYFAGIAMQGLLANTELYKEAKLIAGALPDDQDESHLLVKMAVSASDALLAELAKTTSQSC